MDSKKKTIRITNIQRMCFHDGPGIRTTVFLKGCKLRCPWCSNPENISFNFEKYSIKGEEGVYGKDYTIEELYPILIKDRIFWEDDGGVTFSGGEPLLQAENLIYLLKKLKKNKINTAIETSLFVPKEKLVILTELIDYFIVDIKILNPEICKEALNGKLSTFLENVEYLYNENHIKLFRIPLNYEYTFSKENRELIISFLNKYKGINVQIFPIHNLGETKYHSLGMNVWKYQSILEEDIVMFNEELQRNGIQSSVIRI